MASTPPGGSLGPLLFLAKNVKNAVSADVSADDPFPCTAPPKLSLAELRMDDPFPCTAPPKAAMA